MRICVVAGSGELPEQIISKLDNQGIFHCLIGLNGFCEDKLLAASKYSTTLDLGSIGKAINFCHDHNISHIVFAGSVRRPSLTSIIPDMEGAKLLTKLLGNKLLGDDNLLKIILEYFSSKGFEIMSPSDILSIAELEEGSLTENAPSTTDFRNIDIGTEALRGMSEFDIGQALVVSSGRIIAVEAAEGTDNMIERAKDYVQGEAFLIKLEKIGQDERVDMPVIGTKTIEKMKKSNIKGLVISKKVIILSRDEVIRIANSHDIIIYVIK